MTWRCRWAALFVGACGGGNDPSSMDAGVDGGMVELDASNDAAPDTPGDAAHDAAPGDCVEVTIGAWELALADDVSVGYEAFIAPSVGSAMRLGLLFERYVPGEDVGTFDFGSEPDNNFGTCAHCAYVWIDLERAYYASSGTLVTTADPYSLRLQGSLTGLRLQESAIDPETRASTPIEGGGCIEVMDTTIDAPFAPMGWTCDAEDYGDGARCDCTCGAFDPDCAHVSCDLEDPSCEPRGPFPIVDCDAGEICAFDPLSFATACAATCNWLDRAPCSDGSTCLFSIGVQPEDVCESRPDFIDAARFGEPCSMAGLQKVCQVEDGFPLGYCDYEGICKPVCDDDLDCTSAGDTCQRFLIGDAGLGFCGTIPTDG